MHWQWIAWEKGKRNATIPGVVCLAFAIELAIKSLLLAEKNQSGGHKLDELFGKLSSPAQAEIICQVGLNKHDFLAPMAAVANAFVNCRYIYEAPGVQSIDLPLLHSV